MVTNLYYDKNNITIYHDDCLDILETLSSDSIDSIVTDPPYGLSKQPDITEVLTHWLNGDSYKHAGSGFMGKQWDSFVPAPSVWKECLRVLKPGGHLVAFAGTRTVDLMGISLRLGGFEIRDMIAWVYGQGFPKSLDIGKKIDRMAGKEREIIGDEPKFQQWDGWGTGLKPALEPILLCRKPISEKNIAANVLKWGTGGINIDGCRVGTEENLARNRNGKNNIFQGLNFQTLEQSNISKGRFPANLILSDDDEVRELFPETGSGGGNGNRRGSSKAYGNHIYGDYGPRKTVDGQLPSNGSAARFFYCAKSSKAERNTGLVTNIHSTVKPLALMRYLCHLITPPNGIILDPFAGSGSTLIAAQNEGFRAIGIELEEEYCEIAKGRLMQIQPALFNVKD